MKLTKEMLTEMVKEVIQEQMEETVESSFEAFDYLSQILENIGNGDGTATHAIEEIKFEKVLRRKAKLEEHLEDHDMSLKELFSMLITLAKLEKEIKQNLKPYIQVLKKGLKKHQYDW